MRSRLVSSNPDDMLIEATFREGGPLGLKLNEEEGSGRALVVMINMGTQVRSVRLLGHVACGGIDGPVGSSRHC